MVKRVFRYGCLVFQIGVPAIFTMCSGQPVAINYGTDKCAWCDRVIDDNHFGSTLVAQDGRVFKFNSIECLMAFHIQPSVPNESFQASWVCDYHNPGHLIRAGQATYVQTAGKASPNGVGLFAFVSDEEALQFAEDNGGQSIKWDDVKRLVKAAWFESAIDTTGM